MIPVPLLFLLFLCFGFVRTFVAIDLPQNGDISAVKHKRQSKIAGLENNMPGTREKKGGDEDGDDGELTVIIARLF